MVVVKVNLVYSIVVTGAVHLPGCVFTKLNKSRSIAGLHSPNKGIHFFVNLDIVLHKLGLKTFFAHATAEVVSDCRGYFMLVCVDAGVINNHSFLSSTSVVIAV